MPLILACRVSGYTEIAVRRRHLLFLLCAPAAVVPAWAATTPSTAIRGTIVVVDGSPRLKQASGQTVSLTGDEGSLAVLKDPRVIKNEVEVKGHFEQPGRFAIDPIHLHALFAYKDGHRYEVTYWCPVCSIRSYSPGKCWCCQEETNLDLIEPTTHP